MSTRNDFSTDIGTHFVCSACPFYGKARNSVLVISPSDAVHVLEEIRDELIPVIRTRFTTRGWCVNSLLGILVRERKVRYRLSGDFTRGMTMYSVGN